MKFATLSATGIYWDAFVKEAGFEPASAVALLQSQRDTNAPLLILIF